MEESSNDELTISCVLCNSFINFGGKGTGLDGGGLRCGNARRTIDPEDRDGSRAGEELDGDTGSKLVEPGSELDTSEDD